MVDKIPKKNLKLTYSIFMGIMSLAIIIMLICEDSNSLSAKELYMINKIDNIIWAIFVVDYFT